MGNDLFPSTATERGGVLPVRGMDLNPFSVYRKCFVSELAVHPRHQKGLGHGISDLIGITLARHVLS